MTPPRGWDRDGRSRDYWDGPDPDDEEPDVPARPCSTPGCKALTREIGTLPYCRDCRPEGWKLR